MFTEAQRKHKEERQLLRSRDINGMLQMLRRSINDHLPDPPLEVGASWTAKNVLVSDDDEFKSYRHK